MSDAPGALDALDTLDTPATRPALEVVSPASGRIESWILTAIVAAIVVAAGIAASARRPDEAAPKLLEWQVSSFSDLSGPDQAIYTALIAASNDLWFEHRKVLNVGTDEEKKDPWPTMQQVTDLLLEPFTEDAAWAQQGRVRWQRVASFSFEGSTVYFGSGGTLPGQRAYLLMLSHIHKGAGFVDGATVWMHPDPNVAAPTTLVRDSLVLNGWKEVVPYSGATEVERLRGTQS